MNTLHGEDPSGKKSRKRSNRALQNVEQAAQDERVRGVDGWLITVREQDAGATGEQAAGLTMTRRFELTAVDNSDPVQTKRVTLYCTNDELAGFRLACAEAARAELEITNPLAGLRHYRTAMLAFPFLPGLDALRDRLMNSAWKMVEATLQSAEESMSDPRTWPAARPALERVKTLIAIEDALHVSFGARYETLRLLAERVEKIELAGHRSTTEASQDEWLDAVRSLRNEMAGDPESYWHRPGWRGVRERLSRLEMAQRQNAKEKLFSLRRPFIADAARAYNDTAAGRFLEHWQHNGHPPPAEADIAQLQLEDAGALLRRADELVRLHRLYEAEAAEARVDGTDDFDAAMRDANALLHDEIHKLESWQRDLQALIQGMTVARHYAMLGLREPAHGDTARYVLNLGGRKPATPLRQVPHMFVGHPSLLQCRAFVEECAARRATQERLLHELTLCLQYDTVTQPDQLPLNGDDFNRTLRGRLQSDPPAYPIEVAYEKLRAMRHTEPADACGLQKGLIYFDNDDHQREHASLPAIEAVLLRKRSQVHALRDWLSRHRHVNADFPGVVSWSQEKQSIQALRDSGPAGLAEAQSRCLHVKDGGNDGLVEGVWPLSRMCSALAQAPALAHLRHMVGEANALPLCAAARDVDQQRHALWLACERDLRECDAWLKDIALRIEQYPAAWDAFEMTHRALMAAPFWRRRRMAYRAEWQAFQRAAEAFHNICPDYSAFRARLQDVKARFHLAPEFFVEQERRESEHA